MKRLYVWRSSHQPCSKTGVPFLPQRREREREEYLAKKKKKIKENKERLFVGPEKGKGFLATFRGQRKSVGWLVNQAREKGGAPPSKKDRDSTSNTCVKTKEEASGHCSSREIKKRKRSELTSSSEEKERRKKETPIRKISTPIKGQKT